MPRSFRVPCNSLNSEPSREHSLLSYFNSSVDLFSLFLVESKSMLSFSIESFRWESSSLIFLRLATSSSSILLYSLICSLCVNFLLSISIFMSLILLFKFSTSRVIRSDISRLSLLMESSLSCLSCSISLRYLSSRSSLFFWMRWSCLSLRMYSVLTMFCRFSSLFLSSISLSSNSDCVLVWSRLRSASLESNRVSCCFFRLASS
mmetsp:Transcript_74013/g.160078  ORF Transcript_74013/g.160078 Transcript_74013/m.160078 type:complete len:205 (-) Transcript_74013:780-1394(-)